jgi:hypothetical protein
VGLSAVVRDSIGTFDPRSALCAQNGVLDEGGRLVCFGGRSCFDRWLNPTATSALPARLSVTSESRTNCFRVAIRGNRTAKHFAPLTLRNGNR